MRFSIYKLLVLLLMTYFVSLPALAITLSVNGAQQNQVIDGYGTNVNTGWWNNGEVRPAIDMLVDQLGASMIRAVIEESDWENVNDDGDPNNFNWNYYNTVFSSGRFPGIWDTLRYLNQKGISDGLIISVMGKPPGWMGTNDGISTANEDEYVESLAALFYYARNVAGIQFHLISPVNEPDTGGIEGPNMAEAQTARIVHKLAVKLDAIGMSDLRFNGPDAAGNGVSFFNAEVNDPVIVGKMAAWGVHSYGNQITPLATAISGSAYPNMKLWVNETATYSHMLTDLMTLSNANLVWDGFDSVYLHAIRAGRGSTPPNDSPGIEAPLIAYNSSTHTYTPRKGFYQHAQLFKFVRPGARRIGSTDNSTAVIQYAFRNTNGQLVIVGFNNGSASQQIDGSVSGIATSSSLQLYQTNSSLNLQRGADVAVSGGAFSVTIPGNTYFTLVDGSTDLPELPTVDFSANPTSVSTGGSSTLSWSSQNATSCSASGAWSGTQAIGGMFILSNLTATSTYTLTCVGEGGSTSRSVTVTVSAPPPPPTVTISANPTSVYAGGSSTLSWSSTNASSCAASGAWSGAKATSGSESRTNLSATGTYTLTCTGNGSAAASATITVNPLPTGGVSIFTNQTPAIPNTNDGISYELGMKFRSSQAGTITGIRYYKAPSETGSHTGRIWSSTGTQLASIVFSGESASGWQTALLSTPLAINANTTYIVSVNASYYVATNFGLQSSVVNGPLSTVADGVNGVYGNVGAFPQQSWNTSNYFRDVVFVSDSTQPPQSYSVTPSGSNVSISPSGVQNIASGARATFTVTANSGFALSSSVGGTCPAGTWSGSQYTTGVISANCTVGFSATAIVVTYAVTPSGSNVAISPSGVQNVNSGSRASFTVTANSGFVLSSSVGGTCPAGTWSGSQYTTGVISANCTVGFSANPVVVTYAVTPSGSNVSISPSGVQNINSGSRATFTVTANSGFALSNTVGGTCPAGTWSGNQYTTGVISANCTVGFSATAIVVTYAVTPSGSNVAINPSGVQNINSGSRASFTVVANSGYSRSNSVSGTCPAGSWSGDVYTTGVISANCTVGFSATAIVVTYAVTSSGSNVAISPSGVQNINSGSRASFTVTANSGFALSNSVGGTCPAGSWSGSVYTSGVITAACSVSFSATAVVGGTPISLFTSQVPAIPNITDEISYELGMKFRSSQAGVITAIRYYRAPSETGSHTGRIWSSTGTQLASIVFSGESASGWQTAYLTTPLNISANTTYVVTVNTTRYYVATNFGMQSAIVNGPLSSIADGANGVYGSVGAFPRQSWNSSNYFRDVIFVPNQ